MLLRCRLRQAVRLLLPHSVPAVCGASRWTVRASLCFMGGASALLWAVLVRAVRALIG